MLPPSRISTTTISTAFIRSQNTSLALKWTGSAFRHGASRRVHHHRNNLTLKDGLSQQRARYSSSNSNPPLSNSSGPQETSNYRFSASCKSSSNASDNTNNASATPPTPPQTNLTGSAKLFLDAELEEAPELQAEAEAGPSATMSNIQRRHTEELQFQHPNWTGDETTQDAVLRMLVDKYKPLRTGKIQTAEEKLRSRAKGTTSGIKIEGEEEVPEADSLQAALEARINSTEISVDGTSGYRVHSPPLSPRHPTKLVPSETGSWASEPLLPSSSEHRPWHTTFKVSDHATIVPSVKSAAPLATSKSGSGGVSRQGQDPADPKAKQKERENAKKNMAAGRLGQAREAMLDYRLGLKGGGEGSERVGPGRPPNPQSLKGWTSLVEDRIEKARKAGAFAMVKGRGKPLAQSTDEHNPFIAREEFFMNRIVQRNGAAPPWVELQTELESAANAFRGVLEDSWIRTASRGISSSVYPMSSGPLSLPSLGWIEKYRDRAWEEKELAYHNAAVAELNSLVRKYNGVAPYAVRRPLYVVEAERERVYKECAEKILEALRQRGKEGRLGPASASVGGGGGGGGGGPGAGPGARVVESKQGKGWVLKDMLFAAVDYVLHLGR